MIVELPAPAVTGSCSLRECIAKRRSERVYTHESVSIPDLSQLLWAAQGSSGSDGKRTTPSAGSLYPLVLHVLVRRVSGVEAGIYSYQNDGHSLKLLDSAVPEPEVSVLGIGDQPWLKDCAVIIGVAVKLQDSIEHFAEQPPDKERGARYVYMEAGAMAQNVHLCATDLGLGFVLVAGFSDPQAKRVLKLPPEVEPAALLCIGRR